jgi:NAD(P)-dependent dehydrogenase (short-subunit alcohol dehydrogenase family)
MASNRATKTVLITGATSGIGKSAAIHLKSRGHDVIATGRNAKALEELSGQGIHAVAMDVTSADSIESARVEVDRITEGRGVDVLVNNAGYGLWAPMEQVTDEDLRAQFETNVFGLMAVTRAFVGAMRSRGSGTIINVSSVGGRIVFPFGGAYHATKYAVEAMSDALRLELAQFGIGVSLIEPGYIRTNFTKTTLDHLSRYKSEGSPYEQAFAIVDGIEAKLDRYAAEPIVVSKAIARAAEARRPRARYVAPWPNAAAPWIRWLLPTSLLDWVLRRVSGLVPRARLPAPRLDTATS